MSSANLNTLLDKATDWDKDERYMATNDLIQELQKDIKIDATMERRICAAVLKQLDDSSNDVQSIAVKCLGVLLKKVQEAQVGEISDKLCSLILDGKDELRDIYSIGLKTLLKDVPHSSGAAVCESLTKRLVDGVAQNEKAEVKLEALENLTDLLKRFGADASEDHKAVLDVALAQLDEKPVVRKRAAACLAALLLTASDAVVEQCISTLLTRLDKASNDGGAARTLIATVGTIARAVGGRLGRHLPKLVPALLAHLGDADDEDSNTEEQNELRETCFQGLEAFVLRCRREVEPHVDGLLEAAMRFAAFDPNYQYDDDDEAMADAEEDDDEDYGDEDYGGDDDDDDDDTSWKVRRAAIRLEQAVATTRPERLAGLYATLAPALVDRFKEREEHVRIDAIDALAALLRASAAVDGDAGGWRAGLSKVAPATLAACLKQLSTKAGDREKPKAACFGVLRQLCAAAEPGALAASAPTLVGASSKGLAEKSQALRLEGATLLRTTLETHGAGCRADLVAEVLPAVASVVGADWYKLIGEGLQLVTAVAELVRPLDDVSEDAPADAAAVATQLYAAAKPRLEAKDMDQEIKERSVEAVGGLVARLGDVLAAAPSSSHSSLLEEILAALAARLANQSTRVAALRALAEVARSPRDVPCASLLENGGLADLAEYVKQTPRSLRQATLEAAATLLEKSGATASDADAAALLEACAGLVVDDDLHLAHLAMQASAAALRCAPAKGKQHKKACEQRVLPAALALAASPLLQGAPLDSTAVLFEEMAKCNSAALKFDALFAALPDAALAAAKADPARGSRQARQNVAAILARLCAGVAAKARAGAVKSLVACVDGGGGAALPAKATPEARAEANARRHLALLTLGEIGRRVDLSGLSPSPVASLQKALGDDADGEGGADEQRTAAAAALGMAVAGAPAAHLAGLLDLLDADPCPREYLLLLALREVLRWGPRDALAQVADRALARLLRAADAEAEPPRALAAECAGALVEVSPDAVAAKFLDVLLKRSAAEGADAFARQTACGCARAAVAICEAGPAAAALAPRMASLLKLLDDADLDVRKECLVALHATAHHHASLLEPHLAFATPRLAALAQLVLKRVVDLGPFKHTVDDGLPLRKAALAALLTLVTQPSTGLDCAAVAPVVAAACGDKNADVQLSAHQVLAALCARAPDAVAAAADAILDPLDKAIHKKIKAGTSTDDRAYDLVRSALRAVLAVAALPDGSAKATAVLDKARAKDTLKAELAKVSGASAEP